MKIHTKEEKKEILARIEKIKNHFGESLEQYCKVHYDDMNPGDLMLGIGAFAAIAVMGIAKSINRPANEMRDLFVLIFRDFFKDEN